MQSVRWRRLSLLSAIVGVLVTSVVPSLSTPAAAGPLLPAGTSRFVALPHMRLADTRAATPPFGFVRLDAARTIRVRVAGPTSGVPANATAVVVNITAVGTRGRGVVAAYPSDMLPPADSQLPLNLYVSGAGQSRSNMVTVRLSGGTFNIRKTVATDLTVDLVGAYVPISGDTTGGRFVALSGVRRVLNDVPVAPGASVPVNLGLAGVPADASAALITIIGTAKSRGIWTAFAEGVRRAAVFDLVLDTAFQTRANQTIVPLNGTNALIRLFSGAGGVASVEVTGYYTGDAAPVSIDGLFLPRNPQRRLDTRVNRTIAPFGPFVIEFTLPGAGIALQGFVGNLFVTDSWDAGVVRTQPAGTTARATLSTRITAPRQSFSISLTGQTSSRAVAISSDRGANLVVELQGVFIGARPTATLGISRNRTFSPTPVVAVRWSDALGTHVSPVVASVSNTSNDMTRIADRGIAAAFKGMETLGKKGNTMLFGHRTTHGGIFRYLHTIRVGGTFSLRGADGRWYNYRVTNVGVTTPVFANIANMATPYPPVTAQLIACSKRDGTPTSLNYRIVVTGQLVSVS